MKKIPIIAGAIILWGIVFLVALVLGIRTQGGIHHSRSGVASLPFIHWFVTVKPAPPEGAEDVLPGARSPVPQKLLTEAKGEEGAEMALAALNRDLQRVRAQNDEKQQWLRQQEMNLETQKMQLQRESDRVLKEIRAAKQALDVQKAALDQEEARVKDANAKLDSRMIVFTQEERESLKKTAELIQTMDPEVAAASMTEMCAKGPDSRDTAVKLLSMMTQRQAGKILDAITELTVRADLMERLTFLRPQTQKAEAE